MSASTIARAAQLAAKGLRFGGKSLAALPKWLYKDMPKTEIAARLATDAAFTGMGTMMYGAGLPASEVIPMATADLAAGTLVGPLVSKLPMPKAFKGYADMFGGMLAYPALNKVAEGTSRALQGGKMSYEVAAEKQKQELEQQVRLETLVKLGLVDPRTVRYSEVA